MTMLASYLLFDGTCQRAMEFYQSCLGGDLSLIRVKDTPAKDSMPAFQHEKTLNAHLKSGHLEMFASDWLVLNETRVRGNTVCLFLRGENFGEIREIFERLSEGADVTDPPKQMFFGTYAALNDKFGVRWMFHSNK